MNSNLLHCLSSGIALKEPHEIDESRRRVHDLKQRVTELYELKDKVLAQDRNNFDLPLHERLKQHPIQLHSVVQHQGPIVMKSVKDVEKPNTRRLSESSPHC
jgi:hypothetical protein